MDCFVQNPTRLTSLAIGVCDNGASDVELVIKMETDSGNCQAEILSRTYHAWSTELISEDQLGSCHRFDLSRRVKVSFIYPSSDQLCIDRIVFNEVIK